MKQRMIFKSVPHHGSLKCIKYIAINFTVNTLLEKGPPAVLHGERLKVICQTLQRIISLLEGFRIELVSFCGRRTINYPVNLLKNP